MSNQTATRRSHIQRQKRRLDGRVIATYSNEQLYELVRIAAETACPDEPWKLSVRQFDRTIGALGYADAPSARAICARLKRSWTEIVQLALDPERSTKKVDAPTKREEAPWLTERHVFFALNTIARFKSVETMTQHDYDRYLDEYLAKQRKTEHVLGTSARFPTSGQILRIAAGFEHEGATPWDKALIYAQLKPVPKATSNALTVIDAIDLYIEATLCQFYPSRRELPRLRTELGVSIQGGSDGRTWSELLKEALDRRTAAGLPVPTMQAAISMKPKLTLPPGFNGPAVGIGKGTWAEKSDSEIAEALIPYVIDCTSRTPPVRPTKKDYQSWSVGRREVPSADTLSRRKSWGDWMKLAEALLMEQQKAA